MWGKSRDAALIPHPLHDEVVDLPSKCIWIDGCEFPQQFCQRGLKRDTGGGREVSTGRGSREVGKSFLGVTICSSQAQCGAAGPQIEDRRELGRSMDAL